MEFRRGFTAVLGFVIEIPTLLMQNWCWCAINQSYLCSLTVVSAMMSGNKLIVIKRNYSLVQVFLLQQCGLCSDLIFWLVIFMLELSLLYIDFGKTWTEAINTGKGKKAICQWLYWCTKHSFLVCKNTFLRVTPTCLARQIHVGGWNLVPQFLELLLPFKKCISCICSVELSM